MERGSDFKMALTVVGTELPLVPPDEFRSTLAAAKGNVVDVFRNKHKQRHNVNIRTYR